MKRSYLKNIAVTFFFTAVQLSEFFIHRIGPGPTGPDNRLSTLSWICHYYIHHNEQNLIYYQQISFNKIQYLESIKNCILLFLIILNFENYWNFILLIYKYFFLISEVYIYIYANSISKRKKKIDGELKWSADVLDDFFFLPAFLSFYSLVYRNKIFKKCRVII